MGWIDHGRALCFALMLAPLAASAFDISGPPGSVAFGSHVAVLPNGNIVVTDPDYAGGIGSVHLYSHTGTLLSTLTGSAAGDRVGDRGVTVLPSGNYLIRSPNWANGGAPEAGAVTFGQAAIGVSGQVSAANSLVGSSAGDGVGDQDIVVLANGNYVVPAQDWSAADAAYAGAATWGSGTSGVVGEISASNSLVGSSANDQVGSEVLALANGNYVVASQDWDSDVLVDVGAVTWGDGSTGVQGMVSAANSLIGSSIEGGVGSAVVALRNGHYVVMAPRWDDGVIGDVGATTWGNGFVGTAGVVSATNSLIGANTGDQVGSGGITALSNGNYVVASPNWDNGDALDAGAATWRSGAAPSAGVVSLANSLVGSTNNDRVASNVTALSNGHYVVCSPFWDDAGLANAGAATWGDGNGGTQGPVSASNSLAGEAAGDFVCATSNSDSGVVALSNGHFVVISFAWGGNSGVGAVTWRSGSGPSPGRVTAGNSLTGSSANDFVGNGGAVALTNGNYVVRSTAWDDGATVDAGAATWGSGTAPTSGALSAANSLVGTRFTGSSDDPGIVALPNGNYVVSSIYWGAGLLGAATVGDGASGAVGAITVDNSLTGTVAGDSVGNGGVFALPNGEFIAVSRNWNNGGIVDAGAISLLSGTTPFAAETVHAGNSVLGVVPGGGLSMVFDWDAARERLIVGLPASNLVTVRGNRVFKDGFE